MAAGFGITHKEGGTMARSRLWLSALAFVVLSAMIVTPRLLVASNHDDGEMDLKGRAVHTTDFFVFREQDQNAAASANDLVFIMNVNPRSLPRQGYDFSTNAQYDIHVTRAAGPDAMPTGKTDAMLRFEFGAPAKDGAQPIKVTAVRDGMSSVSAMGVARTTPLAAAASPIVTPVAMDGGTIYVFAGLREDPFFFDVEQFFRVRAGALGTGPKVGFREPGYDFTAGYNVLSIAVRVPRAWLAGTTSATTFDAWTTVSVGGKQVARLARPAIGEGLLTTAAYQNALNGVGPDFEAAALAGHKPEADAAGPIVAEAKRTLMAFGNDDKRATALLLAFLPDVMRIDTTGPSGYAAALNMKGSPVRGRKITDDVIHVTLSVVTNGAVKTDNVTYAGPNGGGTGHKPLLGTFPYLAEPN
jgi:hypothetical protein